MPPSNSDSNSQFSLRRIDIKRSDGIDQIKFTYDDDTAWFAGHDGGKADARAAIMTQGEYLVRVTHERFENLKSAGAAVKFETSKGRVFCYQPTALASKRKDEETTMHADPGHEIISLNIERGVLKGIEQRPLPAARPIVTAQSCLGDGGLFADGNWSCWHVVATLAEKEDEHARSDQTPGAGSIPASAARYRHFRSYKAALRHFRSHATPWVTTKAAGRAAVLINANRLTVLQRAGRNAGRTPGSSPVALCIAAATAAGFCAPREEGGDVSVLETLATTYRLLSSTRDAWCFVVVVTLLFLDAYFTLQSSILTGHVLTMFGVNDGATPADIEAAGWLPSAVCSYLNCTSGTGGSQAAVRQAMLLSFVIMKVLECGSYVLNVYVHHNACDTRNHRMRMQVFEHVLHLDQSFFDTHADAEIRGGMNVHAINNLISWNVPYIMARFLKLVLTVYFMATINASMAAVACSSLLIMKFGLLDPIERRESVQRKVMRKVDIKAKQVVDEAFSMITSIKLFSKEEQHGREHADAQRSFMASINARVVYRCVREFGYGVLKTSTFCFMLWVGLRAQSMASISASDLTAFFLLFQQFQNVFSSMKWHYNVLKEEFPDIERFLQLMQERPHMRNGKEPPLNVGGAIEFRGVHFAYPARPGEQTLKGLDLSIQPNKITAIVGDSGAGKSTITKLLMRLYDPSEGVITVGGQDLRSVDIKQMHDQVAIVPQNPELFNCSLADNIAYGTNGDASEKLDMDRVVAAAKLSNCHEFITGFRAGYDTFAGARGAQISAGQKQRIAIARAAMRQPKILILDEATSSLDVENERVVQEALERVMAGRTTLIVAHRLCTIKNADEIICMKEGRVAEKGTHDSLLAKRGAYYRLVRKQLLEEGDGEVPTAAAEPHVHAGAGCAENGVKKSSNQLTSPPPSPPPPPPPGRSAVKLMIPPQCRLARQRSAPPAGM